jgi:hypothetical protein
MAEAEWDDRIRRTGFYETINRNDGFKYQRPVCIYLVTVGGFGPFLEPVDAFPNREVGGSGYASTAGTGSEYAWKKADRIVELGKSLNDTLEDPCPGEVPTPIHACSWGWPA